MHCDMYMYTHTYTHTHIHTHSYTHIYTRTYKYGEGEAFKNNKSFKRKNRCKSSRFCIRQYFLRYDIKNKQKKVNKLNLLIIKAFMFQRA